MLDSNQGRGTFLVKRKAPSMVILKLARGYKSPNWTGLKKRV